VRTPEEAPGRPAPESRKSTLIFIVRLAGPPIFLALLATAGLAAALARFEAHGTLAVNAWLLAVGGLALWLCWRLLASALPGHGRSAFDSVREHGVEAPSKVDEVISIEAVLLDAEWSWGGVEHRFRPLVRRIASARLIERYQVDMESQPDAARGILGEELWALVRPGPYGPAETAGVTETTTARDRSRRGIGRGRGEDHRRGIPRATIKRTIDLLEAL
jgi:hypothetical protein